MLGSSISSSALTLDFLVMLVVTTLLVVIGGWLYPRIAVLEILLPPGSWVGRTVAQVS